MIARPALTVRTAIAELGVCKSSVRDLVSSVFGVNRDLPPTLGERILTGCARLEAAPSTVLPSSAPR
jgi:hypothetical protein